MILKEISVRTLPKNEFQKRFNSETWCIREMYWRKLGKFTTEKIEKVVMILGENRPYKKYGSVLSIYKSFNFETYFNSNELDRKKIVLELIHNEMTILFQKDNVNKNKLIEAYNYCLGKNLDNKWLFKEKHYQSPKDKYYGSIECEWNLNNFKATGIISDLEKNEIYRAELLEVEPYEGDFIYWSRCGWDGDTFYLESKDKKKWNVIIPEVIQ